MHGGHESEGERAGRKGVAPLTESCHRRALLRRHGWRVGRSGEGSEGEKEGGAARAWQKVRPHGPSGGSGSGSRMAESAAAWCERWKWQRDVREE